LSLTNIVIKGISWNAIGQLIIQLFNIGIVAVLARLLLPKDFGLIGLVGAFVWFVPLLRDVGLSTAVIQKKDLDQLQLSSVFWIQVALGFFCSLIIITLSPIAGSFFKEPQLEKIMMVLSASVILTNIGSVQEAILMKSLNFRSITIRDIIANIVGGVGGVVSAFLGYGVWSLVIRTLMTDLLRTVLLWIIARWRPSFRISIAMIRPLINFGINKTIQRFFFVIKGRLDFFLIGKFLGSEALGYYIIAFNLAARPNTQVSSIVSSVTFPALSLLQDDLDRFRAAYLNIVKIISILAFPVLLGILVMAPEIIAVIYGANWAPSIPVLQILCLWGLLNIIAQPAGTVFFALGKAKTAAKWELAQAIIMILALSIGIRWGLIGVAWSWVISWIIIFPINQYIVNRMIAIDFMMISKKLKLSSILGITMILFVYVAKILIRNFIANTTKLNLLVLCIMLGAVLYFSMYLLLEKKSEIIRTRQYILSIIK